MRFETRYDSWLVGVLIASAAVLFTVPAAVVLSSATNPLPVVLLLIVPLMSFVLALTATLPQYYELRNEGLFIRQGWRKVLLPYSSLCEIEAVSSALSAPVFSTHRLRIAAASGYTLLIAVTEQERFLDELAQRTPQMERWPDGLRTRGGSPSRLPAHN